MSKLMKIPQCDREQQVLDALQCGRWTGPWGDEIRRHAAACAECSEVVLVAQALRHEDELARTEMRVPSAGLVWWKAQLAARRAAEERAAQPIAWAERMGQVFGALALLGLGLWQWPRILGWLGGSKSLMRIPEYSPGIAEWAREFFRSFAQGFGRSPGYLLLVSAGVFLTLVAFAAYAVWREE
jgi:hypothetical protein